jgi:LAO/AO transport system kinase
MPNSDTTPQERDGVEPLPPVNPYLKRKRSPKLPSILALETYVDGITNGDRVILSKAITLVESTLPEHQALAQHVIHACIPFSGKSIRIGITGVPGVGKSSFLEALGMKLISEGRNLAILAVDPSSEKSGGSILGDKTRMEHLARQAKAFIRPSPASGSLGGVARKTRESMILCEAAGYEYIFIETVGVGQSETAVHNLVDFFLLLMLAGAGDELQGIKRGIMEMADAIAINKADGNNILAAQEARQNYEKALHLFPPHPGGWIPQVITCSAHTHQGLDTIWDIIQHYHIQMTKTGYFRLRRREQARKWMYDAIEQQLKVRFFQNQRVKQELPTMEQQVVEEKLSPFDAAAKLLSLENNNPDVIP